jgi:hypothetical protein
MFARIVIPALALILLIGCSDQPHGPRVRTGELDEEAKSPTGLSDEELRKLAERIAVAVQKQDAAAMGKLFDWNAIIYEAASDIQAPIAEHNRFAAEMKGTDKKLGVLGMQISAPVAVGASYTFLRSHIQDNQQRLLFRLSVPDSPTFDAFNYHDLILSLRPDGEVRATDVYSMMTGELLSQTTRRAFLMTILRLAEESAAKLQGIEKEFQQHFTKMQLMREFADAGQSQDVLKLYDQLPLRLQRDKNVMLTRLSAAQNVGGDAFKAAIDEFRTYFPDDPSIERFSITYFADKRDYTSALAKVDVIDKAVGGDPFLDVIRSGLQLAANNPTAARAAAEKALAAEPTLYDAHVALVNVSLQEKKFGETLDRLKEIARRFPPAPGDLTQQPKYAEFVKSPQFQQWLKSSASP